MSQRLQLEWLGTNDSRGEPVALPGKVLDDIIAAQIHAESIFELSVKFCPGARYKLARRLLRDRENRGQLILRYRTLFRRLGGHRLVLGAGRLVVCGEQFHNQLCTCAAHADAAIEKNSLPINGKHDRDLRAILRLASKRRLVSGQLSNPLGNVGY